MKYVLILENFVLLRHDLHIVLAQYLLAAHRIPPDYLRGNEAPLMSTILHTFVALQLVLYHVFLVVINGIPAELNARLVQIVDGQILWLGRIRYARCVVVDGVQAIVALFAGTFHASRRRWPAIRRTLLAIWEVRGGCFVFALRTR